MNNHKQTSTPPRRTLLRSFVSLFALSITLGASLPAQTETLTIDANNVVRNVPAGLGGVCAATEFWNTLTPNYRDDLMKARIGLVRIVGYPADSSNAGTLEALDRKVAQIINMGATPLFIQCIESDSNTAFKKALLRLDGTLYPDGDTTPINQRVATNITYLVSRYRSAPFNLATQYWEIGNEPDLATVNYRVANSTEYINFFSLAHNRLTASGVRGNVLLAGPVTSWDYGYDSAWRDLLMNDFLTACGNQVDIVTRHIYACIYSWEGIPASSVVPYEYSLLNDPRETLHFDSSILGSGGRGEGRLLAAMNARGVPSSVGTGVTEMNANQNQDGSNFSHTLAQGLWFVLSNHYSLYNPRSYSTNGFQFDRNNDNVAYYKNLAPSFPYYAAYIHGVLTGDQVLAQTSSNSHLVVTGSKDANYIYVQVLNRDTTSIPATVTLNNSGGVGAPTEFTLSATQTPLTGTATTLGTSFTRTFPPMTATVFRYPRNSAPTPPTPPAPPTTTVLSTSFDSVPAGMQTYADVFTPVVASSRLQLTSNVANMRAAVVFNGQPLPASRNRAQIRFGFQVVHNYAEGFVFGAYSASPGAVGDPGQALGYYGQANRLWGVKIDNSPDQIGVVGSTTNALVDGWATQALATYAATDMFMVIDYDGVAGTVRARMYQGLDDTGTLRADVTNRVGNPSTLPAGTVFGFTGATSAWSQTTYIYDLAILADNGTAGTTVGNSSFETPALAAGAYQYNVTGGVWSFVGRSGLQSNGSAWGAPAAPNGTQTAFVQASGGANGNVSQVINFASPGTYTVTLNAAARASTGGQTFNVRIDGVTVGTFTPVTTTSFTSFTTPAFTITTAGNHTLSMIGTATSGDKAVFIDSVGISP